MRDFNENFLPDMFDAYCYETKKKYKQSIIGKILLNELQTKIFYF